MRHLPMSTLATPLLPAPLSTVRRTLLVGIQVIELLIIGGLSVPALLAERIEPAALLPWLSLLAAPSLCRFLVSRRLTPLTLAFWPFLLLLGVSLLTIYITPAWQVTWPELVRLLWGMALCLAVIAWLNPWPTSSHHRRLRFGWAIAAFFGLGFTLTAVGVLVTGPTHKFALLDGWLALLPQWSLGPTTGFNPNRVAGVAVLLAPLALALAVGPLLPAERSFGVWVQWLLTKSTAIAMTLFFGSALLLMQSRSAWLAFGCAVVALLTLLGRRGWLLLAGLLLVSALVVAAIGPSRLLHALTVYDLTQISPDAMIQDRNVAGRLILWQRALHGLADAPFTGMGLAAFEALSQQPYPSLPAFKPDPDMSHVHNILLQVGLDFGLPGLLAFLGLLALMGSQLWRLVRQSNAADPFHTWSRGLFGCFVAYGIYHLFDAITLGARPALIVWFLFGLCLGIGEWSRDWHPVWQQAPQAVQDLPADSEPYRLIGPSLQAPTTTGVQPLLRDNWEERAWAFTAKKIDRAQRS